jgi:hypothetical protein
MLLEGKASAIDVPKPFSGKKGWHSLAETAFYGAQLARLGEGRAPDLSASYTWAMIVQVITDVFRALSRRAYGIGANVEDAGLASRERAS